MKKCATPEIEHGGIHPSSSRSIRIGIMRHLEMWSVAYFSTINGF